VKRLAEVALVDLKKNLEKLKKTQEDDLGMIENLCRTLTKMQKLLMTSDLVKTLSAKEQKIEDVERALSERSETSGRDDEIGENLKLLFEEYREALRNFGARPGLFPDGGEISDLMDWMQKVFRALPDLISGATDFTAVFQ
jgi:hypothetical protein